MVRYGDKPGRSLVFSRGVAVFAATPNTAFLQFSIGDAAHGFGEKPDQIDTRRAIATPVKSATERLLKKVVRLDHRFAGVDRGHLAQPDPIGVGQIPYRAREFIGRQICR